MRVRRDRDWSQEIVAEALSRGANYSVAGELAGVTAKTVQRWMQDPRFARMLSERRGARLAEVTGLLLDATTDAVGVIRRECVEGEKAADRLRAARTLRPAAMLSADVGDNARVVIDTATAFAASWNPFVKLKPRATAMRTIRPRVRIRRRT